MNPKKLSKRSAEAMARESGCNDNSSSSGTYPKKRIRSNKSEDAQSTSSDTSEIDIEVVEDTAGCSNDGGQVPSLSRALSEAMEKDADRPGLAETGRTHTEKILEQGKY